MDYCPPGSSLHGIPRQEYWSGLPCPSPGALPNLGTEPESPTLPALAGRFFTTSTTWEAPALVRNKPNSSCVTQTSPSPAILLSHFINHTNEEPEHSLLSLLINNQIIQIVLTEYLCLLLCLFTATISDQTFIPNLLNNCKIFQPLMSSMISSLLEISLSQIHAWYVIPLLISLFNDSLWLRGKTQYSRWCLASHCTLQPCQTVYSSTLIGFHCDIQVSTS